MVFFHYNFIISILKNISRGPGMRRFALAAPGCKLGRGQGGCSRDTGSQMGGVLGDVEYVNK